MNVSFTGTRDGMTEAQQATVRRLLDELRPDVVHHGDCVGSDDEFADMCAVMMPRPWIVAHPGESSKQGEDGFRAFNANSNEVMPVRHYFARNRDMVNLLRESGDVLVATPKQTGNSRGGTWYTVKYAEGQGKRIVIVWPDGTTTVVEAA